MKAPLIIARRYLSWRFQERFIPFLSLITILGIVVSVFSFVVIHSVMNGFSDYLKQTLIGFNAHLRIELPSQFNPEELQSWLADQKNVLKTVPILELDAIMEPTPHFSMGVKVRGLPLEQLLKDPRVKVFLFDETQPLNDESILLGEDLYTRAQFLPGDQPGVVLVNPFGDIGPTGEPEPRVRSYKVAGLVNTGFYEYDTHYVYMPLSQAKQFAHQDQQGEFLITLKNDKDLSHLTSNLLVRFSSLSFQTWGDQNKRLLGALRLERAGMILLLFIVMTIACFNVISLVSLLSVSRSRDVALLKMMGLSSRQVFWLFCSLGLFLGVVGAVPGFVLAVGALIFLKSSQLPLPPAYYIDTLPVSMDSFVMVLVVLAAPLVAALASMGPALKVSKTNTAEILRST